MSVTILHSRFFVKKSAVKYCFVFVCQQGELEIKAMLLAASLRLNLDCDHELVAAIPQPENVWGQPKDSTLQALASLNVRIEYITNKISTSYPIGNKISCFFIKTAAEKTIFLDSDMLLVSKFSGNSRFSDFHLHAKPSDLKTFSENDADWLPIYQLFGLDCPLHFVESTYSKQRMYPYFNAGFIAAHTSLDLGPVWLECCLRIDAEEKIKNKRPWLDQIAFPVAAALLKQPVDVLSEQYNHPSHLRPIDAKAPPFFCHYHQAQVLQQSAFLSGCLGEIDAIFPFVRSSITSLRHPQWAFLLHS